MNFLNAKSNFGFSFIITFSKSSSSSCPGTYFLLISLSLYVDGSSGYFKLSDDESLSFSTTFPSSSLYCEISAIFVNFLLTATLLLTLHIIWTSVYDNFDPLPSSFFESNAFNNVLVVVVTFLVFESYVHLSFILFVYVSVESTKSRF